MKKTIVLFIILIFLIIENLCAQNYHDYDYEVVKTFTVGDDSEQLGVYYPNYEIGVNGPSGLGFNREGECLIIDHINSKIKYYAPNWVFIGDKENTSLPVLVRVEEVNSNFTIDSGRRFQSYNSSKESVLDVEFSLELSNERFQYYSISNLILISKNDSFMSIINPGPNSDENNRNILNQEQTLALFNEPEKYGLEGVTIDDRNRLFIDGELQTKDYKTFYSYWMEQMDFSDPDDYRLSEIHKYRPINIKSAEYVHFLGIDNIKNMYWRAGNKTILVFDDSGRIKFRFEFDFLKSKTQPAIHPSGDVYFLDYDTEGVYVYRIQNVWDPEARDNWASEQDDVKRTGILNDSRVRIRDFPNLEGNHLGYLNKNQRVEIIGQTSTEEQIGDMSSVWYKIRTEEGLEGWVYGWFIDIE